MQNVMSWMINKKFNGYKWRYKGDEDRIFRYLKLQVENSLDFGWKKEDIIIISNFDFEYMGVKSNLISNKICEWSAFANKMISVDEMIKKGIINQDFWLHDVDAYQLEHFTFPDGCKDWNYSRHDPRRNKPQTASGFFRKTAYDIIDSIARLTTILRVKKEESFFPILFLGSGIKRTRELEKMLNDKNNKNYDCLLREYEIGKNVYGKLGARFSYLNYTYNLTMVRYFYMKYPAAEKPIKITHFHPEYPACVDCFCHGKNKFNVKIVTPHLSNLFAKYGLI